MIGVRPKAIAAATIAVLILACQTNAQTSPGLSNIIPKFFGIPINLKLNEIRKLRYSSIISTESGEGDTYTVASIIAERGVRVKVIFDLDGKFYRAQTRSTHAVGPRRIGVGSTLANVRRAWPNGRLNYGVEDGPFVTYVTGTNLLYRFNPSDVTSGSLQSIDDKAVPPGVKVQLIEIFAFPIPAQ